MDTLVSLFLSSTSKFAPYPAFKMRPRWRLISLTYHDTELYAYSIASFLQEKGLKKGDAVILIAPNTIYWGPAFFGILLAGGIVVPLNPVSSHDFVERIIKETNSKFIITISALKFSDISGQIIVHLDELENIYKKENNFQKIEIKPDDIAEIVYTSGTTGEPKGVILTHKNIVSNVESIKQIFSIDYYQQGVSILPLFHMYEQTIGLILLMQFGVSIMYAQTISSKMLEECLKEQRSPQLLVVPEILEAILHSIETQAHNKNKYQLLNVLFNLAGYMPWFMRRLIFRKVHKKLGGKLRVIWSGGAPLLPDVEEKWRAMGFVILQGFGLTETSPVVSTNLEHQWKLGSVGKAIPEVMIRLAHDNEICIKGPNVFQGYYKNTVLTQKAFDEEGFFKTGDIGFIDEDGFIFIQGRKKYIIITSSGENVYPEDVESELKKNPVVEDAAVIGLNIENRYIIHAVLLGKNIDGEKVVEEANKNLARYQHIQSWSLWPETDFPRSATRKIQKDKIVVFLENKKTLKETSNILKEPSQIISILATIARRNSSTISLSSKLIADLHFDSLMRIELVSALEDQFDVTIPENAIDQSTTVEDIENLIKVAPKITKKISFKEWLLHPAIRSLSHLFFEIFVLPFTYLFFNINVEGKENVENVTEPALLMPNHISYMDAILVLAALPRKLRKKIAIAAALDFFYHHYWYAAWFLEFIFNTYPLARREEDNIKPGLQTTGKLLDKGYSILIFPEGRISHDGKLQPLKKGTGLLATEMMAPVIPIVIKPMDNILMVYGTLFPRTLRKKVTIKFGKPQSYSSNLTYDEASKKIEDELKFLAKD